MCTADWQRVHAAGTGRGYAALCRQAGVGARAPHLGGVRKAHGIQAAFKSQAVARHAARPCPLALNLRRLLPVPLLALQGRAPMAHCSSGPVFAGKRAAAAPAADAARTAAKGCADPCVSMKGVARGRQAAPPLLLLLLLLLL